MPTPKEEREFIDGLRKRIWKGAEEYGDASVDRPADELFQELEEEALDISGWGFILWTKIHRLRVKRRER